jgi:hypothetical protein
MSGDFDQSALIEAAFVQTWRDVVEHTPALSMLPADANICKHLRHKVREGYETGITDVSMLSAYARASLPQKRKFRRD